MKRFNRPIRSALWLSVGLVVGLVAMVMTPALAASHASSIKNGPGYPPPKGIYKPFTDCPIALDNAFMQATVSGDAVACVAGDANSGTIKIGNITTPVVHPVTAQFGACSPPNASPTQFSGCTLPPPDGVSAELTTGEELVPVSLEQMLGCPSTNRVIEKMCQEAANFGGSYNQIYVLAQEALPITNFAVFSWTQPIKIQLVNPLLGSDCYIGTNDNPITVNPNLQGGTLIEKVDPNPTAHPNTAVLEDQNTTAVDNTFAAPAVTDCGPGGSKDIPVENQMDSYAGLPAASGSNSLSLSGNFYLADCFNSTNQAKILLNAIEASSGTAQSTNPSNGQKVARLARSYGLK